MDSVLRVVSARDLADTDDTNRFARSDTRVPACVMPVRSKRYDSPQYRRLINPPGGKQYCLPLLPVIFLFCTLGSQKLPLSFWCASHPTLSQTRIVPVCLPARPDHSIQSQASIVLALLASRTIASTYRYSVLRQHYTTSVTQPPLSPRVLVRIGNTLTKYASVKSSTHARGIQSLAYIGLEYAPAFGRGTRSHVHLGSFLTAITLIRVTLSQIRTP